MGEKWMRDGRNEPQRTSAGRLSISLHRKKTFFPGMFLNESSWWALLNHLKIEHFEKWFLSRGVRIIYRLAPWFGLFATTRISAITMYANSDRENGVCSDAKASCTVWVILQFWAILNFLGLFSTLKKKKKNALYLALTFGAYQPML